MPAVGSVPVEQPTYPLELLRCERCGLAQIGCEVDPEVLFPPEYPYLSGSTRILKDNFADLYAESRRILGLGSNDFVVDIGSNDGTLLSNFKLGGHRVLGVEPSQAGRVARRNRIPTLESFFGRATARRIKRRHGPASVVTAANVFAHIGDIHGVVDGILKLLRPGGVFISESHYLLGLLKTVQYDTIYHEHLRYYSVASIAALLRRHGLEIFHVKPIPTHGGSIRVYAARKGERAVLASVKRQLDRESAFGLSDGTAFTAFRNRVIHSKLALNALLDKTRKRGERIYGIGAPSRSSTLINYAGLDEGVIECILEVKNSHKLDKYVPGTRIPVVEESRLYRDQPDYALLFSWHIAAELIPKLTEKGFRGRYIVPLPVPRVLGPKKP